MTKEEVMQLLAQRRRANCDMGMSIPRYMDGIIQSVFEVTAEILEDKNATHDTAR